MLALITQQQARDTPWTVTGAAVDRLLGLAVPHLGRVDLRAGRGDPGERAGGGVSRRLKRTCQQVAGRRAPDQCVGGRRAGQKFTMSPGVSMGP